jgi:hypothetical protein
MAILCRAAKNSLRGTDAHSLPKYPSPVLKPFNLRKIIKVRYTVPQQRVIPVFFTDTKFSVGEERALYGGKLLLMKTTQYSPNKTGGKHVWSPYHLFSKNSTEDKKIFTLH